MDPPLRTKSSIRLNYGSPGSRGFRWIRPDFREDQDVKTPYRLHGTRRWGERRIVFGRPLYHFSCTTSTTLTYRTPKWSPVAEVD